MTLPDARWIEIDATVLQLARDALRERAQTWGSGHPNKRRDNLASIKLDEAWQKAKEQP